MKKIIWYVLNRIFFNRTKPRYIRSLYVFASRYTNFFQGDNNLDRATNGGWRFLNHYLTTKKPQLIFDVGAHHGEYIKKIRSFNSDATLYAFEPTMACFSILENSFRQDRTVIPFKLALSTSVGKQTIYTSSASDAISTLSHVESASSNGTYIYDSSEEVSTTTVDTFVRDHGIKHIDLLKIDTEGNDLDVLKGAYDCFSQNKIDTVIFEFGVLNTFSHTYFFDFFTYLNQFNFTLYKIKPFGLELVDDPLNERSVYAYFVAYKT